MWFPFCHLEWPNIKIEAACRKAVLLRFFSFRCCRKFWVLQKHVAAPTEHRARLYAIWLNALFTKNQKKLLQTNGERILCANKLINKKDERNAKECKNGVHTFERRKNKRINDMQWIRHLSRLACMNIKIPNQRKQKQQTSNNRFSCSPHYCLVLY